MTIRHFALSIVALLLATAMLSAHDDYRIIGTVARITATTIDVKQTKDGKIIAMKTGANTIVTRDKKKVARADVKVGANVVVDARGDSLDDLLVVEVRLVPPPSKK